MIRRVFATTLLAVALSGATMAQEFGAHWKGKAMPAFKMTDTKGKVHTNSSLKGKVVLLDFWATWCGPCKAASPTMQKLHTKYASKGLVVVGANVFEQGPKAATAAADYAKEHKYTYTFTKGNDALAAKLGINGIPAFLFIDRKGVIREVQVGFDESLAGKFEQTVQKLLKG